MPEKVSFQHIHSPHFKAFFLKVLEAFRPLHSHPSVVMQIPKIDYTMQAQALFDFRTLSQKRWTYKMDINDRLILEDLPEEVLVA